MSHSESVREPVGRHGSSPPIVLVHGLGSRREVFDPLLDRLSRRHEVFAVDLPGFGRCASDPSVHPGPVGYAAWLRNQLEEWGLDDVHLVGNSMGGGIALELGRSGHAARVTAFSPIGFWKRPGRVWCQRLLSSLRGTARRTMPLVRRGVEHRAFRAALLGSVMARPARVPAQAALEQVAGLVSAPSFAAASASFDSYDLTATRDWGALRDIPVTIAWGSRDFVLTTRTQSARARQAMPFARHVLLSGCGHVPFFDDPDQCTQIIVDQQ